MRTAKYLWFTKDYIVVNSMDRTKAEQIVVQHDADWGSSKGDLRSTSGCRITYKGMLISSSSQTQPGLPALSSGESEIRSMCRAVCECQFVQDIFLEMGIELPLVAETDASVALAQAQRL